jgi:hypothetical protein
VIDLDLSKDSEDRRATVAAFLNGVLSELRITRQMSIGVRVTFGTDKHDFRITYEGPSRVRRKAYRPG